ncbi:MAG: phosphate ABC transporter permease PstA [Candidatus Aminicenantes bacterium]|uniref:Phosphate transport system permease protein PstA n=1 Tax=Candidatus Saccharicenans subterraneus TaxID=2508984 RepID=A0A3E2BQA1_9BACT|nr:phosphate ABC transporter permease PstA [Candidatus Aminicenantes bacterium]RFT16884.1 MAG: Phosphate transport system permease protein PstA [Candidatus Saccharicenans subterraneum]
MNNLPGGQNPGTLRKRLRVESFFKVLMAASALLVLVGLVLILAIILWKSLPALKLSMIIRNPGSGYYLGREGGILNAILGSLQVVFGATLLALAIALPAVVFLNSYLRRKSWLAELIRFSLDVLWGIPSIVYGAFGFLVMITFHLRASLLAGLITVAMVELPILSRALDETIKLVPPDLKETTYSLGASRWQTATRVVLRQTFPGLVTGVLMAMGRGLGDAAAVLFTAGYTDKITTSLLQPVATLPLAIFFQLNSPFPEVQQRAFASAAILTILILLISLASRSLSRRLSRHKIR